MINKKIFKDKYFWIITTLIGVITFLHYSNLMSEWELHIFYRKLYYIPIILSSFRYRLKGGLFSSIIVSILYAPHLTIFGNGMSISLLNQYLEMVMFLTIGYITGRLVELDYEKQKSLETKVVEITKLQNYTKNIVDSINSGVLSTNSNFIITSENKEAEIIFGVKGLVGSNINSIFKDENVINIFNQVKLQKLHFTDIKTEIIVDNEEKYLSLSISPLLNILNKVQGLVIIIHDKSREKYLEAQAVRADRLLAIEELASGIAHEIRNPLGIIKTISQTLKEEKVDDDLIEGIDIIIKEIDRANKVIDGLLNFSRPMENGMKEIFLNELFKEVALITNKYLGKQNVNLKLHVDEDANIIGDKEKLKQVFINIIFNGVQSMDNGGTITINTEIIDNGVSISFIDTGMGIKKEDLGKIFNPFFTTKEQGVGLGLSISHRIIQDHKGYMTIDSIESKGTKIDIYLPKN